MCEHQATTSSHNPLATLARGLAGFYSWQLLAFHSTLFHLIPSNMCLCVQLRQDAADKASWINKLDPYIVFINLLS